MAEFLKALKFGSKSTEKEVLSSLRRMDRDKTPILMEIEQSHIHFRSVLSVKKGVVVVAKPDGLGPHLKKADAVRFTLPDEEQDLRLLVISPHFNLTSGNAVFLCTIPSSFTEGSKRKNTRFNTSRFKNLYAVLPSLNRRFRIVDLSSGGIKLFVKGSPEDQFTIGETITPVQINISKTTIDLEHIVPRVFKGNTVGCEMGYKNESVARKYIDHLVKSLLQSEEARLSSDTM